MNKGSIAVTAIESAPSEGQVQLRPFGRLEAFVGERDGWATLVFSQANRATVAAAMTLSRPSEDVAHHRVPKRLPEGVRGEQRGGRAASLHGLDPLRRPIHVRESKPEGELIEREAQRHAEHDGDSQVPPGHPRGERREACRDQQQDAPEEMVDVETAFVTRFRNGPCGKSSK